MMDKQLIKKRWRLILGPESEISSQTPLSTIEEGMDKALDLLYRDKDRSGGLSSSSPYLSQWLKDIRTYFPKDVVKVLHQDAIERLGITELLLQEENLEQVIPSVELVSTILQLKDSLPDHARHAIGVLVRQLADELYRQLEQPLQSAIRGAIQYHHQKRRPRQGDINLKATIYQNLKHYQPSLETIIPETLIGYQRQRKQLYDIFIVVDQSASMAESVIYSGILSAILSNIPALKSHLVLFDTEVADVSAQQHDAIDVLFTAQLGGGTDIGKALSYASGLMTRPEESLFVLVTDLYDGGDAKQFQAAAQRIQQSGATFVTLLALNDDGSPEYDHHNAQFLSQLKIPVFACTPRLFPELMAAAIRGKDIQKWSEQHQLSLLQ